MRRPNGRAREPVIVCNDRMTRCMPCVRAGESFSPSAASNSCSTPTAYSILKSYCRRARAELLTGTNARHAARHAIIANNYRFTRSAVGPTHRRVGSNSASSAHHAQPRLAWRRIRGRLGRRRIAVIVVAAITNHHALGRGIDDDVGRHLVVDDPLVQGTDQIRPARSHIPQLILLSPQPLAMISTPVQFVIACGNADAAWDADTTVPHGR